MKGPTVLGWMLNIAYLLLILITAPLVLFRSVFRGNHPRNLWQKISGRIARRDGHEPCCWLHAVSVGEVLQIRPLIDQLKQAYPGWTFVISTTTGTGFAVAEEKYRDCRVVYFPFDFTWAVQSALEQIHPNLILLVELELWPNFIRAAANRGIPVALVNGRVSEKSYQGYRKLGWLLRPILRRIQCLAMQTEEYQQRIVDLGARLERTSVSGSVKFDGVSCITSHPLIPELRRTFRIHEGEPVFIAGSTQSPEEEIALDVWDQLRRTFPTLRLILVPRHKERFDEVARLVQKRGLPLLRRSQSKTSSAAGTVFEATSRNGDSPIGLLDTLGELSACWGLADFAFVGGSLTARGGQNMMEPAAHGAAVCFGPNTQNFRAVVDALLASNAAKVVRSGLEMQEFLHWCLTNPLLSKAVGQRAREFVLTQQGATSRTVEALKPLMATSQAAAHRRAA